MKSTRILKKRNEEKGQSMVELAVSLVILLILLAGVVDFGRLTFHYLAMHDATQEGASYGSIFPHETNEIINRINTGLVVDNPTRITIYVKIIEKDDNDETTPPPITKLDCSSTQTCASDGFDENKSKGYAVGDIIEITVIDNGFPLDMPFFGGSLITVKTTIKDSIIRVPTSPE